MPSLSRKQHNLMAMVANNPTAAKRTGVPQSVGDEFMKADKGRKFGGGGMKAKVNSPKTRHGKMAMPNFAPKKFAAGGGIRGYAGDEGSYISGDPMLGLSGYLAQQQQQQPPAAPPAQAPAAQAPATQPPAYKQRAGLSKFGAAFDLARHEGKTEFDYEGDAKHKKGKYNTRLKEEGSSGKRKPSAAPAGSRPAAAAPAGSRPAATPAAPRPAAAAPAAPTASRPSWYHEPEPIAAPKAGAGKPRTQEELARMFNRYGEEPRTAENFNPSDAYQRIAGKMMGQREKGFSFVDLGNAYTIPQLQEMALAADRVNDHQMAFQISELINQKALTENPNNIYRGTETYGSIPISEHGRLSVPMQEIRARLNADRKAREVRAKEATANRERQTREAAVHEIRGYAKGGAIKDKMAGMMAKHFAKKGQTSLAAHEMREAKGMEKDTPAIAKREEKAMAGASPKLKAYEKREHAKMNMSCGGMTKKYAKGGAVRGDGCAVRGKTKGVMR